MSVLQMLFSSSILAIALMMMSSGGEGPLLLVAATANDVTAASSSFIRGGSAASVVKAVSDDTTTTTTTTTTGSGSERSLRFAVAHYTELGICLDHPNLQYERVRNGERKSCTWVGENIEERCQLTHPSEDSDHLKLEDLCPVTCKVCTPELEVSSESSSSCVDFPRMEYLPVFRNSDKRGNPKECDWVKKKPNQRCNLRYNDINNPTESKVRVNNNVYADDGVKLHDYCPLSCGMCGSTGTGSAEGEEDYLTILTLEPSMAPSVVPVMAPTKGNRKNKSPKPTCPCNRKNHTDTDGIGVGGSHDPTTDSEMIEDTFGNPCEADAAALAAALAATEADAADAAAALAAELALLELEEKEEEDSPIIGAKESSVNDDEPLLSTFEIGAIAAGIVLLLLLLLLCCTCCYYRKLKQAEADNKEVKIIIGSTSEDSSKGSRKRNGFEFGRRLVDYVVSIKTTRSGNQYNVTTDVHQCSSAYCVVCEQKRQAIMSFDSYDDIQNKDIQNQQQSKQLRQVEIIEAVVKSQYYTGYAGSGTGSDTDASDAASHTDVSSENEELQSHNDNVSEATTTEITQTTIEKSNTKESAGTLCSADKYYHHTHEDIYDHC